MSDPVSFYVNAITAGALCGFLLNSALTKLREDNSDSSSSSSSLGDRNNNNKKKKKEGAGATLEVRAYK